MIQQAFLDLIKAQLQKKTSLIEEVATVLDVSYDAAHRRVSQKSKLSLEESVMLAKHFGISLDQLFSNEQEHIVAVKKTAPVKDLDSLLAYYINSYNSLLPIINDKSAEMIYSAKDLPIFYTSSDSILTRFKIFAWLKIISPQSSENTFSKFNLSLSLLEAVKKLGGLYNHLNATEIWDITTINSTLKQIHFYFECNVLTTEEALAICQDLKDLMHHISKKIMEQKDTFKFYYNELLLMNNRVLVKTSCLKSLYVPFTILSYYRTNDVTTCNQAEDFLKTQMEGSKLLSSVGEKERNIFFNKMHKKIETLQTLITANNVLEFE